MEQLSPFHWLIVLAVIVLLFGGRRINPRKPPTHPLPVTSPVETSATWKAPKEKPWEALIWFLRPRRPR
jgi:hypothetical protein